MGIALIGIAQGLGVPVEMAAGAIISGALVGDKLSPLSDTTLLASATSGVKLFDHITSLAHLHRGVWAAGDALRLERR